jgi:hypothetical protein
LIIKTGFGENHSHLKILSWRVCQRFQRTCHDAHRSGEAEKIVFKTDASLFLSGFAEKQVNGKIILGHLKFLSRRVCQGFQRTCHDTKGSEETEKTVLEHDATWFQGCFTHVHLKFLSTRVCQGFQRTCHYAKGSEKAEKAVFGTLRKSFFE